MNRIRLAIADDSQFVRKAIARLFQADPQIKVVGSAATGEELLENLGHWRPDIITLDLSMPGMGGLKALDRIMETYPTRVIVLSTHSAKDAPLTIEALSRGAVDYIDKQQYSLMDFEALRAVLRERILQVTRSPEIAPEELPILPVRESAPSAAPSGSSAFEAIVIGASTGGPPVIEKILADIGAALPIPIAVVQHMSIGFTKAFADRLNANLPMSVREATHGERFLPGNVYIGPSGFHLRIRRDNQGVFLALANYPADTLHQPSVDVLFESAAHTFGNRTVALLLTGMGRDGAAGMAELAKAGAYTMAQDEASCVVFGMPRAALELGAVCETVDLADIGSRLKDLVSSSGRSREAGHASF